MSQRNASLEIKTRFYASKRISNRFHRFIFVSSGQRLCSKTSCKNPFAKTFDDL